MTVHVDGSTKFRVQGVTGTASLSDVTVGMGLIANGEKNADGSLNADQVLAGSAKKLRDGTKPGNPTTTRTPARRPPLRARTPSRKPDCDRRARGWKLARLRSSSATRHEFADHFSRCSQAPRLICA